MARSDAHTLSLRQRWLFALSFPALIALCTLCLYVYHHPDWTHPVTERIFRDGNFAMFVVPCMVVFAIACEGREMIKVANRALEHVLPIESERSRHKD